MKRTEEQINQEYSELCAKLGDIEIKKGALDFQKNEIIKKVGALAKERNELDEKVDEGMQ